LDLEENFVDMIIITALLKTSWGGSAPLALLEGAIYPKLTDRHLKRLFHIDLS